MQPLINILIRTSNRPAQFRRLLRSIARQTYKNIRLVVSYDTTVQPAYIPAGVLTVDVGNIKSLCKTEPAFYNRYCNVLKEFVHDGYFVIVDDDDYIPNRQALEELSHHLAEDKVLIFQMSRHGRKKPTTDKLVPGKIGMPCIALHHSHKHLAMFDGSIDADYKFIKAVCDQIGHVFAPLVVVECGKRGMGKV